MAPANSFKLLNNEIASLIEPGKKGQDLDKVLEEKLRGISIPLAARLLQYDRPQDMSVRQEFTWHCLHLLTLVHEASKHETMVSIVAMNNWKRLISLIVGLALAPHMPNGVGLPLSRRIAKAKIATSLRVDVPTTPESNRLFVITSFILSQISLEPTDLPQDLAKLLLHAHLSDILGSLITICSCPTFSIDIKSPSDLSFKQCAKDLFNQVSHSVEIAIAFEAVSLLLQPDSPRWLQRILGRVSSRLLLSENGVESVLMAMIGTSQEVESSKLEKVASILFRVPRDGGGMTNYFRLLSTSLAGLLTASNPTFSKTAAFLLGRMLKGNRKDVAENTVQCIAPILQAYGAGKALKTSEDGLVEREMDRLEAIMRGAEPDPEFLNPLLPVFGSLVWLHHYLRKSIWCGKSRTMDLLLLFLRLAPPEKSANVFLDLVIEDPRHVSEEPFYFAMGPSGGVVVKKASPTETLEDLDDDTFPGTLVSLLLPEDIKPSDELMKDRLQQSSGAAVAPYLFKGILSHLVDQTEGLSPLVQLSLFQLATTVADRTGPSLLMKSSGMYDFIIHLIHNESNEQVLLLASKFCLAMVQDVGIENINDISGLNKRLGEISSGGQATELRLAARELSLWLSTSTTLHEAESLSPSIDTTQSKDLETFTTALHNLRDSMLPIRAYGVSSLKALALSKSPVALNHLPQIIDLFLGLIKEEDSFVYSHVITAYSGLADAFPDESITPICRIYMEESELDAQVRFGEVLAKIVSRLGEMVGKYANIIVPSVLRVLEDVSSQKSSSDKEWPSQTEANLPPQALLCSSCLSILSTIASTSPSSLIRYLSTILTALEAILINPASHVLLRRGSCAFITALFQNASMDLTTAIQQEIKPLYNALKLLTTDADELTRINARMGMEAVDDLVIGSLKLI